MISHTDPQHFSFPSGTLFIEFFSLYGLCWAGHIRTACTRKLLTVTSTRWFCRRTPVFSELVIGPVSSVLGSFVDNTEIPLSYHRDDSVVGFWYYQQILLSSIKRGIGSNYWPVLDWAWEILVQDRFITNITQMEKFFHQKWKIISEAQSVWKATHQGPGTGWLPSDIKNSWQRTFWKKLEELQACPTWSEVTSAEWLIR